MRGNQFEYAASGGYAPIAVGSSSDAEKATFIRRTYGHLAGAVMGFVLLEVLFFGVFTNMESRQVLLQNIFSVPYSMLFIMGAFIGAGMLAQYWAHASTSKGMQYAGLALYVLAQAVIFVPILTLVIDYIDDPSILPTAGLLTLTMFGGLTAAVFVTRKDFSFLRTAITIASFVALGLIICSLIFGFSLGLWFSFAMVALACCFILYDTSNVLHHYQSDQYVGAALQLFASVAILFFYILRILIASRD